MNKKLNANSDGRGGSRTARRNMATPNNLKRRVVRLSGYNYSQNGYYFVTICVKNNQCLFGDIANERMNLNHIGRVVSDYWLWLAKQYDYVKLDEYVIMPNHIHGILIIDNNDILTENPSVPRENAGGSRTAPTEDDVKDNQIIKPLGRLIGAFKTLSTKHINISRNLSGAVLWQRGYYEHIIRSEDSLLKLQQYIVNNPTRWQFEKEKPTAINNNANADGRGGLQTARMEDIMNDGRGGSRTARMEDIHE